MILPLLNKLYSAYIRIFVLRNRCGPNTTFHFPVYIYSPKHLSVGRNVKIGPFCTLFCQGGITLDDDVLIAANTVISSVGHKLSINERQKNTIGAVYIYKNVWIGAASIILQGVNIGKGSVIGAGSLVAKSIPENVVYKNKRIDNFKSFS